MNKSSLWWSIGLCTLLAIMSSHGAVAQQLVSIPTLIDQLVTPIRSPSERCEILNAEGLTYHERGQYGDALQQFEDALKCFQDESNRVMEGVVLNNMGSVYKDQGNYDKALRYYRWAHGILGERDKSRAGTVQKNIGEVYLHQGRHDKALEAFEDALGLFEESQDLNGKGTILNNIGVVLGDEGKYDEALGKFQEALEIYKKLGNQPIGEATVLGNMGQAYHSQVNYAKALETYEQALSTFQRWRLRTEEGTALVGIGDVYFDLRRYSEALEVYQRALNIYNEVGNQTMEAATLVKIGYVYQKREVPSRALENYQQAIDILETVRAVAGSDPGRAAFITQYINLYVVTTDLYHQLDQNEEAFVISEQSRARVFLDSISTGHIELTDEVATALLAQEQKAYAARQAAQEALARARALDPPDLALVADLEAQLDEGEAAYGKVLAAIEARGDQLDTLVNIRSNVISLSELQAALDRQTTLISYYVLDYKTLAFLVTRDSFHTVDLYVSREELSTQVRAFRDFPNLKVAHPDSTVTLYDWLIEPLLGYLSTPQLTIVSHGVLHYLPFAALTNGERCLVDDYVITYLPSVSALPLIQANVGGESASHLILGNPTTDPELELDPLNYAEQEAQAIAALYDVQPLLGEAATESAVREHASQAGILHLTAHGEFDVFSPLYSTIYLAPGDAYDGRLEVHEVYGLDLANADLVVLSACQTELGHELEAEKPLGVTLGDELVGLSRAFIYAGAPTVVSTLWSVDEQSTALLMERFYTRLQDGMDKAEALRQAQIDARAKYPNPYYWAAFVLSGDPGEMSDYKPEAEATTTPIKGTPTSTKGNGGICPAAGVLILVLAVGVAFITSKRLLA